MLRLFLFVLALCLAPRAAFAATPHGDTVAAKSASHASKNPKEEKEEKDEAMSDAEKADAQKKKDKAARIVVLKWNDPKAPPTDDTDETLQRNVRSRIDRPDALFFPSIDLYQAGRKHPDKALAPAMQPAEVPAQNLDVVRQEIARSSRIPYDSLDPSEWALEAEKLMRLIDLIWFVDKVEQREPLFLLYVQIGSAAYNAGNPAPPFFESIGGQSVNYYFYLAATLALQEPGLMSKITDQELYGNVSFYLDYLQRGVFPTFPLDFELDGQFDLESFDKSYEVLLNGLPIALDENARFPVPLGRQDIYMRRKDTGHGLSDQLIVDKFDEKAYFVRDVARKKMGIEFVEQLFLHPNECSPELDGDIMVYLAIYAKIHPTSEIYIAVPRFGNPNKVYIWRWDRASATLQKVGGAEDEFPVRFAGTIDVGLMYNDLAINADTEVTASEAGQLDDGEVPVGVDPELVAGGMPVAFQLRGHYNRLIVGVGTEFNYNLSDSGTWVDYYRTPVHDGEYEDLVVVDTPVQVDDEGKPIVSEALHYSDWARMPYFMLGAGLGRDASIGLGPRIAMEAGYRNLPSSWVLTAHGGYTIQPPIPGLDAAGRVRPIADIDIGAGAAVSSKESIHRDFDELENASWLLSVSAGVGTTF